MPAVFAVADKLIQDPQTATFAAFGSFAILVLADFGGPLQSRLVAYVTLGTPLSVRTMSGAFSQLANDLEECSRIHGAAWWTTFRRILLALAWPAFAVGWILIFFIILRELSASILLYSVGHEVLSVVVMRLWSEGKAEQVSVIALIMLALVFAFRFAERRMVRTHLGRS